MLGFDTTHRQLLTRGREVGLLQMAVDAFTNAVDGAALARERERLHENLQQAQRMQIVGALASGISHNFNNIVGAILGFAETAQGQIPATAPAATSIVEIRRAGERARDLIQQILGFGRRRTLARRRISLRALIDETQALLNATLPAHVRLVAREHPNELFVSGEPAQLQQVMINLCANAAQAMDSPGVIEIETGLREVSPHQEPDSDDLLPGQYAVLSVTDPGRGMDEATLQRLFEPFFTTRANGNGLGLATAREAVLEHGGAIRVRSASGFGTRFDVWLPATPPPQGGDESAESFQAVGRGNGETILLLDPERPRLLLHEEILAALGYEPAGFTHLADAQAALLLEPRRFDAAVLCTPIHGVKTALEKADAIRGWLPGLPIILATPSAGDLDAPALLEVGIVEVICQPLITSEIASALARRVRTVTAVALLPRSAIDAYRA
jgi:signal transduction histidine kinase/CheY-like chemotaxis protein